uniref:Pentatricopeptide repeat-containing protein n=1 Tax=Salix viminalis TaxID=40686 RepID=A0A6N2MAX3_SALVM
MEVSGQIPARILELSGFVTLDMEVDSLKLQKPCLQHLVEALTSLECVCSGADSEKQSQRQALVFGFELDVYVSSALIDMYSKCGKLSDARILFDEIPYRNIVAWTSLITGNVQNDDAHEALMVFKEFLLKRVKKMVRRLKLLVDSVAMVSFLSACSRVSNKAVSVGVHGVVMKVGLDEVMGLRVLCWMRI